MPNSLFHLQFPTPELPNVFTFDSLLESLDYWRETTGSGGVILKTAAYIALKAGGLAGGFANTYKEPQYPPFPTTWEKKRTFRTTVDVYHENDVNSDLHVSTGHLLSGMKGFGFKFENNKIKGMSINGGAFASVDLITGLSPAWSNIYLLEAIFEPGSKIEFYIDGILKGTLLTQLPTVGSDSNCMIRYNVRASGTQLHEMKVSGINTTQYL